MSLQDERLKRELNFLVLKYLKQPGLEDAYNAFVKCKLLNGNVFTLPSSSNSDGPSSSKRRNLLNLEQEYSHIAPTYLLDALRAAKNVVNSGPTQGLLTILGHSSYTLSALLDRSRDPEGNVEYVKPKNCNNLVANLSCRQYGRGSLKRFVAEKTAKSPKLVARILGHLAPIYCIVIDKTGTVAFTGADDGLVKMWSLDRYFLLATLRGHKKEISDLSINSGNTLLASGSCDKEIRIWCLQTTRTVAVLTGHRASVNSLHFSPNDDYLATAASDGLVCFWPIIGPKSISDDPITFYERVRSADKLLSSSFSAGGTMLAVGSSDGDIFTYTLRGELGLPVRDQTLEGHTAMVITLTFAKHSLRFVSGSKDGTVRVWTRIEGVWDHVVCTARKHVVPDRDYKEQIDVLFAQWSSNEGEVLASCSDTSIRVWNMRGELVQVFLGHDDEAYFVQEHPLVSNVLVTCGHDGHIITWRKDTGQALNTFLNVIEGEGRASVLEASFTPDGETLATVDANGHISFFGHELLRDYVSVPREQFFSSDYLSVIRDRFSNVVDEQTELPPHLVGPPYMVDQQGLALPPEVQGLIPGRHFLSPSDITALKKKMKTKRALEYVWRQVTPRGRILSGERQTGTSPSNPELADFQRSFVVPTTESDLDFDHIPAIVPPISNYDLFDGIMAQSIAMVNPKKSRDLWLNRKLAPPLSDMQVAKWAQETLRAEELVKLKELEVLLVQDRSRKCSRNMRRSCGKVPARSTRQTRPAAALQVVPSSEEEAPTSEEEGDSSDVDWQVSEMRQKRKPTLIRDEEAGENGEPDESLTESHDKTPEHSDEEEDAEDKEEEGTPETPKSSSRKRRCNRKSQRLSSDEMILDQDVLDSIRKPKRDTPAREGAIKKVCRMLTAKTPPRKDGTKPRPATLETARDQEEQDTLEVMAEYKPPKWLTQVQPTRSPYLPQISDKIYYFVQGHMDYANSEHCPPEANKGHPWENRTFTHAQPCQVLSLSFVTGPPTLCQIKLGMLDDNEEVEETFLFRYHDAPSIPDFMVLKRHYEDSINHRWLKGDKFRSLIDEAWWEGTVLSKSPVDEEEYPDSSWKRIMVKWDNEPDKERLSAWDIEPLPKDARSSKRRSPTKKRSTHSAGDGASSSRQHFTFGTPTTNPGPLDPYITGYYHTHGNWGSETREEFKERFSNALLQAMELREAQEFLYPVNFNDHPDYYTIIGYPVDLTSIHNRLDEEHYRSVDSVLWEIRQLEINARVYNEDASDIVRNVTALVTRITIFVKNPTYKLINSDITPEMITDELENRGKSKKRKRRLRVRSANRTEWYERASDILDNLITRPDSHPFRIPVDINIHNDYLKYCQEPMDLETITDKLHTGCYDCESEFYKDIDLIFTNSFSYNTRSTSAIYKMTARLQDYYRSLIDHLADAGLDDVIVAGYVTSSAPRPRTSIPLELVVPRAKRRLSSSGNSEEAQSSSVSLSHSTRSSKGKEKEKEKGKEAAPSRAKRKRIYTSSTSEEGCRQERSSGRSSQCSTQSLARGSSEHDENEETVLEETPDQRKRSKRKKSHVNYEYYDHSFSEEGSISGQSSDSSSWKENNRSNFKSNRSKGRPKSNGRTMKISSRPQRNGKSKDVDVRTETSSDAQSDGALEEHTSSSSSSDDGKIKTRSKRQRKTDTVVTTQRGRSVKKNVRYDDFF